MSTTKQEVFTKMAKQHNVGAYWRIANLAKKFGVKRQTIQSAVARGDIPHKKTGCGLPLVSLESMQEWVDKSGSDSGRPYRLPTPQVSDETLRLLEEAAKKDPDLAAKLEGLKKTEKVDSK